MVPIAGAPTPADLAERPLIQLDLFPDLSLRAVRTRVERTATGLSWIGKAEGYPDSDVVLVASGSELVGNVYLPFGVFAIAGTGGPEYLVQQIETDAGRGGGSDIEVVPTTDVPVASPPVFGTRADDGGTIDLLIVYTRDALTGFGSEARARAFFDLVVADTNLALRNSSIDTSVRLAHSALVEYVETGNSSTDLSRLRATNDGFLDDVHALRDEHAGDIVLLVVEQTEAGVGGRAYRNSTTSTATTGFALVRRSSTIDGRSVAHELGHNLGVSHDWYDTAEAGAFRFSKGYVSLPGRFQDVMATGNRCRDARVTCARILHYSNPGVRWNGLPTGMPEGTSLQCAAGVVPDTDCDADAATTLTRMAPLVARFRHSRLALGARRILPGGAIRSDSGRFRLTYQTDGNLVLYDDWAREARWATATSGQPGEAIVQTDGNFVVYDARRAVVWQTSTSGNFNAYLLVQDDGNLVLYRSNDQPLWAPSDLPAVPPASRPPAPASPATAFGGAWSNTGSTGSPVRASFQTSGTTLIVRMWGRCTPIECDWGVQLVPLSSIAADAFSVQWTFGFGTDTQRISLERDGRLKIVSRVHFTDGSGRRDYETTTFLARTGSI